MQKELVTLADTATAGRSLTQVHITTHTHTHTGQKPVCAKTSYASFMTFN